MLLSELAWPPDVLDLFADLLVCFPTTTATMVGASVWTWVFMPTIAVSMAVVTIGMTATSAVVFGCACVILKSRLINLVSVSLRTIRLVVAGESHLVCVTYRPRRCQIHVSPRGFDRLGCPVVTKVAAKGEREVSQLDYLARSDFGLSSEAWHSRILPWIFVFCSNSEMARSEVTPPILL